MHYHLRSSFGKFCNETCKNQIIIKLSECDHQSKTYFSGKWTTLMCLFFAPWFGKTSSQNLHLTFMDLFSCTSDICRFRWLAVSTLPHRLHWASVGTIIPWALRWLDLWLELRQKMLLNSYLWVKIFYTILFQCPWFDKGLITSRVVTFVWPLI